jgi:hypothetical protein
MKFYLWFATMILFSILLEACNVFAITPTPFPGWHSKLCLPKASSISANWAPNGK